MNKKKLKRGRTVFESYHHPHTLLIYADVNNQYQWMENKDSKPNTLTTRN
jgi:hypothetical protein